MIAKIQDQFESLALEEDVYEYLDGRAESSYRYEIVRLQQGGLRISRRWLPDRKRIHDITLGFKNEPGTDANTDGMYVSQAYSFELDVGEDCIKVLEGIRDLILLIIPAPLVEYSAVMQTVFKTLTKKQIKAVVDFSALPTTWKAHDAGFDAPNASFYRFCGYS